MDTGSRRCDPCAMPDSTLTAIILAAGVARRLAPLTDRTQKSLLHVGGRAILAWMLEAVAAAPPGMTVRTIQNPDYQKGSSLSLYCARDVIVQGPTLIMDADVVFPKEFLRRLVAGPAANAFLIDRGFADTGEEVKFYIQNDRVIALGKKVVPKAWDRVGEGIGFFKCGAEAGPDLVRLLEQVIEASDGLCEYEDALHLLVSRHPVGAVDVTGLPWTEVDFAEDLRRAQTDVFPEIVRLDSA